MFKTRYVNAILVYNSIQLFFVLHQPFQCKWSQLIARHTKRIAHINEKKFHLPIDT